MRSILNASMVLFALFAGVACQSVPAPIQEYTLARTALEAAKNHKGPQLSAGNWQMALDSYRKAQSEFNDHNFEAAKEEFVRAKIYAERAENAARVIKMRNGEF